MEPEVVAKTEKITSYGYVVKESSITVLDASIKMAFKLFAAKIRELEKEKALRESEERFRAIIAHTPDHIIIHDRDLRCLFVANPQLGLTEADMVGKTDLDFLKKEEAEKLMAIKKKVIDSGEPFFLETSLKNLQGESEYFEGSFIPKFDSEGKPDGLIGYFRNVTQRKLVETQREALLDALQESEKRWRLSIENMLEGYALHETILDERGRMVDYRFLEFNPAAQKVSNIARKDIVGKTALELYPHIVERGLMDRYANVMASGESTHINDFYYAGDNLDKALDISCFRIDDRHFACVFRDVTVRLRAESEMDALFKALQVSLEKYRVLFESFPLGITISDKSGKIMEGNSQADQLLGIARDVHVDRRIDDREWRIIRKDGTPMPAAEYASTRALKENRLIKNVEMGIVKDKGEITWINVTAAPIPLADYGVAITYSDITEHRQVESQREAALEALRESEKELRYLLKSMINAFVLFESIFDNGGNFISYRFVYINEAYERITGVKNEEVKGKSVHEVWPGTEAEWIRMYGEVAVTGVSSEFELYHDPTKKLYHCNVYRPWSDKCRFCVVFEDISERKQTEDEIKRQLAEKEILLKEVHHRIKNNIASIGGLISLQMQAVANPQAIAILRDAVGRINNMQLLYDKLLFEENYKDISVKTYLEDLTDTIIALFKDQAKIKLDRQIADFHLDAKRMFPLGSIINELLTNIMKYAFINRKTGLIKISLTKVGKHVTLTVQDNGRGLPPGFDIDKAKGFGLMLVKMLSQQLGGSFSWKSSKGTRLHS